MRIARALALSGIASRRKCETHVTNGAVQVNGEKVTDLGRQVDPANDVIVFRGKVLHFDAYVYYIVHKPRGYLTTAADPESRKTVFELLPKKLVTSTMQTGSGRRRVFPVGRLDRDTAGLLLFTNDGDLANKLMHPRYRVGKWYEARLHEPFDPDHKAKILKGVRLEDGVANVEKLYVMSRRVVRLLICEGKKREVRRIFETMGYKVTSLTRFTFGNLTLENLGPGDGRFLKKKEVESLRKLAVNEKNG